MMSTTRPRTVAERHLTYTPKGEDIRRRSFTVCISEPFPLTDDNTDHDVPFPEDAAGCTVSFDGLDERDMTVHGADSVQALELAVSSMESYLRRLSKKYDFYFKDGDTYFDD